MKLHSIPKEGTKLRICLEMLVKAKGDWVGVWEISNATYSTCAHNLPNELKHHYGAVYENKQWYLNGRQRSSYRLLNWEDYEL